MSQTFNSDSDLRYSTSGSNTVIRFVPQVRTETNTLEVLGNTTLSGLLTVDTKLITSGDLSVLGTADINYLRVKGNATLCKTITVADNTTIGGKLSVPHELDAPSTLKVGNTVTLCGNLSVHDSSKFYYINNRGNTTISGFLQVNNLRLSSTLSVINNNDYFQKRLTVQSNAKVSGTLSLGGQAIIMPNGTGRAITTNQKIYTARRSLLFGDRELVHQYYTTQLVNGTGSQQVLATFTPDTNTYGIMVTHMISQGSAYKNESYININNSNEITWNGGIEDEIYNASGHIFEVEAISGMIRQLITFNSGEVLRWRSQFEYHRQGYDNPQFTPTWHLEFDSDLTDTYNASLSTIGSGLSVSDGILTVSDVGVWSRYIRYATSVANIESNQDLTIMFWMKHIVGETIGHYPTIISSGEGWTDHTGWRIWLYVTDSIYSGEEYMRFEMYYRNNSSVRLYVNTPLYMDGSWHHYTITYKGSNKDTANDGTEDFVIYVDNTLISLPSGAATLSNFVKNTSGLSTLTVTTEDNNIGLLDGSQSFTFKGYLGDVRIYNDAVSVSEVNIVYNEFTHKPIYYRDGLQAYFKLDQASESTINSQTCHIPVQGYHILRENTAGTTLTYTTDHSGNATSAFYIQGDNGDFGTDSFIFRNLQNTSNSYLTFDLTKNWAISFWFRLTEDINDTRDTDNVIFLCSDSTNYDSIQIHYNKQDTSGTIQQFGCIMYVKGDILWITQDTTTAPHAVDGDWHHICVAWNKNTGDPWSSDNFHLFVDGSESKSSMRIDEIPTHNFNVTSNWDRECTINRNRQNRYDISHFRAYIDSSTSFTSSVVSNIMNNE